MDDYDVPYAGNNVQSFTAASSSMSPVSFCEIEERRLQSEIQPNQSTLTNNRAQVNRTNNNMLIRGNSKRPIYVQKEPILQTMTASQSDPNDPSNNEKPVRILCPACYVEITTSIEHVTGSYTYLCCFICVLIGCVFLSWLPFVMTSTKDVIHRCPRCGAECGRFKRRHYRKKLRKRHARTGKGRGKIGNRNKGKQGDIEGNGRTPGKKYARSNVRSCKKTGFLKTKSQQNKNKKGRLKRRRGRHKMGRFRHALVVKGQGKVKNKSAKSKNKNNGIGVHGRTDGGSHKHTITGNAHRCVEKNAGVGASGRSKIKRPNFRNVKFTRTVKKVRR